MSTRAATPPERYAVLGNPVAHSRSPFIHAEFARQTGEPIEYGRVLCPLDGFAACVRQFAASSEPGKGPARGCNVTVPFKLQAGALARTVSARAALAQAANVLRFDDAGWFADNTDGIGLVRDIEHHADFRIAGARVLLVGAGGAAAGVLGPLIDAQPREVVVANRTPARAAELVMRHRAAAGAVPLRDSALEDCGGPYDLVINSTSSSLQGITTPVPAALLRRDALAVDLMYGAAALPFLAWARSLGAQGRDGLGMLVEQAAEAFFVWRGVRPHTPAVLSALRELAGCVMRQLARLLALLLVAVASLQVCFVARVALMRWVDPQSTTFQRSEWWRLRHERGAGFAWSQQWVDGSQIAEPLKRAVIASEDAGFVEHSGVEWDAIERALERNQRAETVSARRAAGPGARQRPVKLVGGSTITQQLAKNLFLSGERTLARKAQEFMLTWTLEALLDKRRILEIYLNSVEWGEGVFGAQAAARHYHRVDASRLSPLDAAHLAVLLPAPKRFERHPGSAYVSGRAATIAARMGDVELP